MPAGQIDMNFLLAAATGYHAKLLMKPGRPAP